MQIIPYLIFNGQCEEALRFYEQHLGAKITCIMNHKGTPAEAETPAEWLEKIMHAQFTLSGQAIMASDSPPAHYLAPQGLHISLQFSDPDEAEKVYNALMQSGVAQMPLQATFWAKRFAMLKDKFGIPWMINCSIDDPQQQ